MSLKRTVTTAVFALLLVLLGCAVNPVTGGRDFVLISEAQEIEMGREADLNIQKNMPQYTDQEWLRYLDSLGQRIAADSERPQLNWSFRILDEATPNAFALPGGHIYFTRGLLATMSSEAQLMGVLGHETGHVTARHSVTRLSRMQAAQLGLGLSSMFNEDVAKYQDLIGAGAGLLFLKYGRGQEDQADELGLRYMVEQGYHPQGMPEVFTAFEQMRSLSPSSSLPNFLSSHPNPGRRVEKAHKRIAALEQDLSEALVNRRSYLLRLDGMRYGINPRHGYFKEGLFKHPDFRFTLRFPDSWKTQNLADKVVGQSRHHKAMVQLQLAKEKTLQEAEEAFFANQDLRKEGPIDHPRGMAGKSFRFVAGPEEGTLRGQVSFIRYRDRIFVLVGMALMADYNAAQGDLASVRLSFQKLTDAKVLNVKPHTLRMIKIDRDMSLASFKSTYADQTPIEEVALINQVPVGGTLKKGSIGKGVKGQAFP